MKQITRLGVIGAAALASAPSFARSGGSFVGMGDLPGGAFYSLAIAASADGSVVVGASDMGLDTYDYTPIAARWTRAQGIRPLNGLVLNNVRSIARTVSGNGQVIGGLGFNPYSGAFAFVWTQPLGLTLIDATSIFVDGAIVTDIAVGGLSFDGTVAAGWVTAFTPTGYENVAFRWTQETGARRLTGLDQLTTASNAIAISSDGHFIVGSMVNANGYLEGFRWSEEFGINHIGQLRPNESLQPIAVSSDGAVVVGRTYGFDGEVQRDRAFRWTLENGLEELQPAIDTQDAEAFGVSGDGRMIVGWVNYQPVIWRGENPPMLLTEYLDRFGVADVIAEQLGVAFGISADGRTIVGYGTNANGANEGFIATIPPHCPGDADRDGQVNFQDIIAVLSHWQSSGPRGDANDDFIVDFNDISEVLTQWLGECP